MAILPYKESNIVIINEVPFFCTRPLVTVWPSSVATAPQGLMSVEYTMCSCPAENWSDASTPAPLLCDMREQQFIERLHTQGSCPHNFEIDELLSGKSIAATKHFYNIRGW